jgi:ABC-type uncharacterized transport system ATPase subunit
MRKLKVVIGYKEDTWTQIFDIEDDETIEDVIEEIQDEWWEEFSEEIGEMIDSEYSIKYGIINLEMSN